MKYPDTVLLVFAKAPIPGKVNTRLIQHIGVEAASELQAELLRDRLDQLVASQLCDVQLWCSPDSRHQIFKQCSRDYDVTLYEQTGNDLGERMSFAFQQALENYNNVVLIGTDAPALGIDRISQSIDLLRQGDKIVLVPAEDGGYVLIGMSWFYPEVFLAVPWGTERVLSKTRGNIVALGLKLTALEPCWDIDRAEDYERYKQLKDANKV